MTINISLWTGYTTLMSSWGPVKGLEQHMLAPFRVLDIGNQL